MALTLLTSNNTINDQRLKINEIILDIISKTDGEYFLNANTIINGELNVNGTINTEELIVTNTIIGNNFIGNANTASALKEPITILLSGDISGNVSFDGSSNVTLNTIIDSNSVELGIDTIGDYIESILGTDNQIYIANTGTEGSIPVLSLPQDIDINANVEFEQVISNNFIGNLIGNANTANSSNITNALSNQINILLNGDVNGSINTDFSSNVFIDVDIIATLDDITEGTTNKYFTDSDKTKLDGIETNATADQTESEIKTAYESNANTNAFTDSDKTKLDGIETNATADQTESEIKTAYESNANTNAFTDSDKTKLDGIASGAVSDHGALSGLSDDDHSQYAFLSGRDGDILNIDQIKAFDSTGLKLTDSNNNGIFIKNGGLVGINTNIVQNTITLGSTASHISTDTSIGVDNKFITLSGGGEPESTRGGFVLVSGNENSTYLGNVIINSGNVSNSQVKIDNTLFIGNGNTGIGVPLANTILHINGAFSFNELSVDPNNPAEGIATMWMSDGTGTGNDGDILFKVTANSVTDVINLSQIAGGSYNDENAQDAIGSILIDSLEIDFTYNDNTPSITASIIAGSIDKSKLDTSVNASLDLADSATQPVDLATVATSGSYDDLINKPSISSTLIDLADVSVTTPTNRNILIADGSSWESRALIEADISDLGSYLTSVAAADITNATSDGIALITSTDANPFTDSDKIKLDGISSLADVTENAINNATAKSNTFVDNDIFPFIDISDSTTLKKSLWSDIKSEISYFLDSETLTFTNKTLENPIYNKGYKEEVYTLIGSDIDPENGTIQHKLLTENTTFTESLESGESVFLTSANGSVNTITWPTITWYGSDGDTAPSLSGEDAFLIWKRNTTLYGAYIGNAD